MVHTQTVAHKMYNRCYFSEIKVLSTNFEGAMAVFASPRSADSRDGGEDDDGEDSKVNDIFLLLVVAKGSELLVLHGEAEPLDTDEVGDKGVELEDDDERELDEEGVGERGVYEMSVGELLDDFRECPWESAKEVEDDADRELTSSDSSSGLTEESSSFSCIYFSILL